DPPPEPLRGDPDDILPLDIHLHEKSAPVPFGRRISAFAPRARAQMSSGARTRVIVDRSFTRMWREGPAVSLNGSPTVSPTTAALCCSVPLPPADNSMWFFALC